MGEGRRAFAEAEIQPTGVGVAISSARTTALGRARRRVSTKISERSIYIASTNQDERATMSASTKTCERARTLGSTRYDGRVKVHESIKTPERASRMESTMPRERAIALVSTTEAKRAR